MLTLLGTILKSLVEPFTNIDCSLTEQLESLSAYAHLSFVMFRLHGTSFTSNQLYADCQIMIKNTYFCVAKQQLLDPARGFFLSQIGDDRLELNFCEVRTSTHHRNVDILDLAQKEAAAMDQHEILNRHRDWDRGHRRLKYVDSNAVDHVNPRSWKGDVVSGSVHLRSAWMAGRKKAETALALANISVDYDALFAIPGLDMLRPIGDG